MNDASKNESKLRRFVNIHKSLHLRLTITFFVVGLVPSFMLEHVIHSLYEKSETVAFSSATLFLISFVKNNLFLSLLVLVILDFLFAFYISKFFVSPIKKITRDISKVSAGYSLEDIHVDDVYETKEISEAFNKLLAQIRELEENRQSFVSNVSHELKTPMTSIKILAESLVQNPDADLNLYKEFMGDISAEIDRENDLIEDLLSLVRIENSHAESVFVQHSINHILGEAIGKVRPIANAKDVEILYTPVGNVWADVDEVKLSLCITNLVENAVKYNNPGGYVKIELTRDENNFYLSVEDNGVGIPKESLEKIYDKFYRVDKSHSRLISGTGLGLSIARSAVLLHNGTIGVASIFGEGTVFNVTIPLVHKN